ncbi:MAG: hypothetical protein LDL25_07775 [Hyphomicrobiales bacterium]|uniref:hypothetical protein n=1 Tax=Rhabdaerophilum calidifontis TaxID=2604328 RepID=UPI00123C5B93|nr:hypothetical protein [Rhabdaerophilum calidifontis]MCA1999673.1 hypothetical protein [Hyphomicrobiales bacterium]
MERHDLADDAAAAPLPRAGDRLLVVLAAILLAAAAFWLWAGNGVQVFLDLVSAGLALCF